MKLHLAMLLLLATPGAHDQPKMTVRSPPPAQHLKTAVEVAADPGAASALELRLAALEVLTASVRRAAEQGQWHLMTQALQELRRTADGLVQEAQPWCQ